ncbi:5-(carboxyamino)imidazole ribonucleotide mutase [Candidatus Parvarchaeota archaeon]|nr:5-(carboxyamino)imidazole ribonucleotide mutase [Candidatus Parvarchaeota archaeon]
MVRVQIMLGSDSDMEHAKRALEQLDALGVDADIVVASAHRNPDKAISVINTCGAEVFIAMAGLSAALPGFVASKTTKPVIGVPLNVKLEGLDALLSAMQMPTGIPVATVAIDGAKNAGILAAQIIALSDKEVAKKLAELRAAGRK